MNDVQIQQADVSEMQTVIDLTLDSFDQVSFESNIESVFGVINGYSWQDRKADHIRADFNDPDGRVLLARKSGTVIGFVSIRFNRVSAIGVIANLAVAIASRNTGIGRMLIEAALDEMRRENMDLARIETLAQNHIGQSLYPKLGFHEIARQIYYGQDLRDIDQT